jgi:rod shape-determining protein MreC
MAFLDRVTRRRLVLGLLLAASLALLTVYFREQETGGQLHSVQGSISDAASPVEGAVQRVAQPFRDAWSWSRDLVNAKGQRDKLAKENAAYRLQIAQLRQAAAVNADAEQLLQFKNDPRFASLEDAWRYVPARVTVRAPTVYNSKVQIDVGTADGVHKHDPVITGKGWLVGQITDVSASSAWVTLINDGSAGEGAWISTRGARGLVQPSSGDRNVLLLTGVPKSREVHKFDIVTTQGWRAPDDVYKSIYPRGLVIGQVTNVAVSETAEDQVIQVTPYADLSSFSTVLVLDPKGKVG